MPLFPIHYSMGSEPGRRRLLLGLGMFLACAISLGLGISAGSSWSAAKTVVNGTAHAGMSFNTPASASVMEASLSTGSSDQRESVPSAKFDAASMGRAALTTPRAVQTDAGMSPIRESSSGQNRVVSASSLPVVSVPERPVIQVPLIYQNVNPALVGLSAAQVAGIDKMRNDFNAQVGATSSPADLEYAQTWASAQTLMDEKLRAFLGWQQFNLYQINAARKK